MYGGDEVDDAGDSIEGDVSAGLAGGWIARGRPGREEDIVREGKEDGIEGYLGASICCMCVLSF